MTNARARDAWILRMAEGFERAHDCEIYASSSERGTVLCFGGGVDADAFSAIVRIDRYGLIRALRARAKRRRGVRLNAPA